MSISNAFKLALQRASNMFFDDTTAQLGETDVQGAIEALSVGYRLHSATPVEFTASGTYTPDASVEKILVIAQGAGGGVRENDGRRITGGGGAGGRAEKFIDATELTIVIGAGVAGGDGGNTAVTGTDIDLVAGGGGDAGRRTAGISARAARGGDGGTASGGDRNINGQPGTPGLMLTSDDDVAFAGTGGSTLYGSGGRAGADNGTSHRPDDSTGYGAGASGTFRRSGSGGWDARPGRPGVAYIYEFVRAS